LKADGKWGKPRALRANHRVLYGVLRLYSVPVKARQYIYGKDVHRLDYLGRSVRIFIVTYAKDGAMIHQNRFFPRYLHLPISI
jgi:hypothetical protein